MKKLLVLGAGTGGTIMANLLQKKLGGRPDRSDWTITVVDRDVDHYYQPGFLLVPFGLYERSQLVKDRTRFLPRGVEFILAGVERVDAAANAVILDGGRRISYDILIIATGTEIVPDETAGMRDGWRDTVFDFYTPEGCESLARALEVFPGGSLVVHIQEMPIKCPIAPLEFVFLADDYFRRRKLREAVEITFVTPLDGAFTKPTASRVLGSLLEARGIRTVSEFSAERVDAAARRLVAYDGRKVPFDLLVTVPTNMGGAYIERSGLGDELRFVPVDPRTLRSKAQENIFVIGDASNAPASKAGSVAHFQSETVAGNILRTIDGQDLDPGFDGHANCFIESGRGRAFLIDFNYEVEPLPGRFPFPVLGPLSLLKESRINHIGKLAFRWIYWHRLLKAKPIPFIPARMRRAGKTVPPKI